MARTGSLLAGVLLGAAAGVVLGVLFAPEEGKETRKKLIKKVGDLAEQAKDTYDNISSQVREKYDQIRDKAVEKTDEFESELDALR